jgi:hypothetical protein
VNRPYRWVIVAAGGLLGCVAIGAMFSLPVFLRPMSQETGWSVTGISTTMTIGFLAMAVASMVRATIGPIYYRSRRFWSEASANESYVR